MADVCDGGVSSDGGYSGDEYEWDDSFDGGEKHTV